MQFRRHDAVYLKALWFTRGEYETFPLLGKCLVLPASEPECKRAVDKLEASKGVLVKRSSDELRTMS